MAYAKIEPFGEKRADLRSAIIACTMANAWRGKNQKPLKPADFMPRFEPPPEQSAEQMKMLLRSIAPQGGKKK